MAVKCWNKRCSKNRNNKCVAGYRNMEFDELGHCMIGNEEKPPYEECANCKFDYKYCHAPIHSIFCIDFEKKEENK